MQVRKEKRNKVEKELERQLMWALENEINHYLFINKHEYDIRYNWVEVNGTIDIEIKWPKDTFRMDMTDEEEKLWNESTFHFPGELAWIDYRDVLWSILNFEEVKKCIFERLDFVMEHEKELHLVK